jgi:hypothetical protein
VTGGTGRNVRAIVLSLFVRQRLTAFISKESVEYLEMLADGSVTPLIGARTGLAGVADAIAHLEQPGVTARRSSLSGRRDERHGVRRAPRRSRPSVGHRTSGVQDERARPGARGAGPGIPHPCRSFRGEQPRRRHRRPLAGVVVGLGARSIGIAVHGLVV